MADSDDGYERRPRDKFRGEREYTSGSRTRDSSQDDSPPMKKVKFELDDCTYPYGNNGAASSYGAHGASYGQDYPHPGAHATAGTGARMQFLECRSCNVPYDEEIQQPRQAPCGHELCSACIKSLIKNGIYECPKCKQKNEVIVAEDLPVNFGLIDVIQAFKTNNISLPRKTEKNTYGATNDELCKVHRKFIGHKCLLCQHWCCDECLDSHSTLTGCTTINSVSAMASMKKEHTFNIETLLTAFDEDTTFLSSKIQEHADKKKELLEKAKKHDEEIKNIQIALEHGKIQRENLVMSKNNLNTANSPYALMDRIEVIAQRKQSLHSWSVKNIGTDTDLEKALQKEKDVSIDMVIKVEENNDSLSHELPIVVLDNSKSNVSASATKVHYFFYEIQTLLIQNVKSYIHDKNKEYKFGVKVLNSLLESEKQHIRNLAEAKRKEPYNTPGICDFGVYLLCNGVPIDPLVNIYICEAIMQVCQNVDKKTPLVKKLIIEVNQYITAQKELFTRSDIIKEFNNWLKSYQSFLECAWILVYCKQQFEKNKLRLALPLILKACSIHASLISNTPQGPSKTLYGNVLWKFRRTCLLTLNEKLYNIFKTGDGQETASELGRFIVPAMAQISTSNSEEDKAAIAKIRNKWCHIVDESLGSPAKIHLSKQILKIILIDLNDVKCEISPANASRHPNVLTLYKQYMDMCRVILGPSI